ncbi:MAG: hypothetical protein OXP69_13700 [Spirochaetaceae bacterium]|nr:hypothetical protein [Spirochaetaceae bacterium]
MKPSLPLSAAMNVIHVLCDTRRRDVVAAPLSGQALSWVRRDRRSR